YPRRDGTNADDEQACGELPPHSPARQAVPALTTWVTRLRRLIPQIHSEYVDRTGDVLDFLRAEVLEGKAQLVQHLIAHDPADADPAGIGQRFQSRRDVNAITEDIVAVDDDVADVDADAKVEPLVGGNTRVALGHAALHFNRAAHCIDHAREFHQQAVPGRLDDAAVMFGDLGVYQLPPVGFQRRQGAAV